jgi:hypothetical protein
MRKTNLFLTLTLTIAALVTGLLIGRGPKPGSGFERFNDGLSSLTDEIVQTIHDNPTAEGVIKAYGILNVGKPVLKKELAELKTVRSSELNGAALTDFADRLNQNQEKLRNLVLDDPGVKKAIDNDSQFRQCIAELLNDYQLIIKDGDDSLPSLKPASKETCPKGPPKGRKD